MPNVKDAVPSKTPKHCIPACNTGETDDMFQCDRCEIWYHFDCESTTREAIKATDEYFCNICIRKNLSSPIKESDILGKILAIATAQLEESRKQTAAIAEFAAALKSVTARVDALEQKLSNIDSGAIQQVGSQPNLQELVFTSVTKAVSELDAIQKKSKRAVIEKLPENSMSEKDLGALVLKVATEAGIDEADIIVNEIRRDGPPKVGRDRIIKVPFTSRKARDLFVRNYRSAARSVKASDADTDPALIKITSFARRDMTPSELQLMYSLRKKAYDMNKECGLYKYTVRDLTMFEIPNPQPLKSRQVNK